MMKRWLLVILGLLFIATMVSAADPKITDVFQYDESKMDVGSMYYYAGTDMEGKNPIDLYVYVQSKNSLVIYKAFDKLVPGSVYVINATFDWDHMMRSKIEATNPLNQKLPNVEVGTKVNVDFKKKKVSISYTHNDENGKTQVTNSVYQYKNEPCYDYGLFHFDLQFAFRFIKEGVTNFHIFTSYSSIAADSEVKYLEDEKVNNIECRKYEIKAIGAVAAAFNVKGYLWLAKNDPRHYTVKYQNYVQRDSFWKNCQIELKEIKTLSNDQWNEFVKKLLANANQ